MDKYRTRLDEHGSLSFYDRNAWRGDGYSILESPLVDEYNRNGYFVIRGMFKSSHNSPFNMEHVSIDPKTSGVRSILGVHYQKDIADKYLNTGLFDLAEEILGEDAYIHQSRINCKTPGNSGWHWHSDFETWHSQDGMPDMNCTTAMIALDDNTTNNGPLTVIPGSHLWYWSSPKGECYSAEENFSDQKEGVPPDSVISELIDRTGNRPVELILTAGDVLFFDCNLMHSSETNNSDKNRFNLFFVFNAMSNRLQKPFSYDFIRPEYMATREYL
jgi:ectoine hydroxylase